MGQLIFIGYGSGAAANESSFLSDVYDSDANYSAYVAASGADAFFGAIVTYTWVFRLRQEVTANSVLFDVVDSSTNQRVRLSLLTGSVIRVNVVADGVSTDIETVASENDLPLGRVFVVTLAVQGNSGVFYVQGRRIDSADLTNSFGAPVAPTGIGLGGSTSWNADIVEYLGFAVHAAPWGDTEAAEAFVSIQDAGSISLPASFAAAGDIAIYNADSITDIETWAPDAGATLTAPDLTRGEVGTNTPVVITAPFHSAHSGWASKAPV